MRFALIAVAVAAFVLRIAYAAKTGALWHPQTWEQEQIATNLLERHEFLFVNHGFVYRSYAEPLYPFLAAAVYSVTRHSRTALVIVQCAIAAATVWLTGRAAGRATRSDSVAIAAAGIAAIHPGLIHYSSILHPFVLDCFFFTAAATALLRYRDEPTRWNGLAAALIIGAGALTRPTILLFLVPLGYLARRNLRSIALFVLTAFAVVAPWTIRNAFVQHTFMLTRSGTGFVLWLGNNPNATGAATDAEGTPIARLSPEIAARAAAARNEVERDAMFSREAWAFIEAHPLLTLSRFFRRLYYFWWFSPEWGIKYSRTARFAYRAWWIGILVMIAVGVIVARRSRSDSGGLALLAALALIISITQSAFYVEGRHRLAIEPLLMPIAAVGVVSILSVSRRRGMLPRA